MNILRKKSSMDEFGTKIIECKDLRKTYHMGHEKIDAVNGVNFEILKGEFCCLLGTSGSGKSTLLNLMAGIEKASGGGIFIKGRNIRTMSEKDLAKFRQKYLGFVFQSYNLLNSMTAQENVEFPLVFKRIPSKKRKKMARDMLVKVGLGSRVNHKPKEMSGGQQQRVGIARAFVAKPEIVFADEPTGNLDTKTTMEVMDLIKGMARENKLTIVMVTHDPRLAKYADKIIHISDGRVENVEILNDINKIKDNIGTMPDVTSADISARADKDEAENEQTPEDVLKKPDDADDMNNAEHDIKNNDEMLMKETMLDKINKTQRK
jgi:putative ABC transport system ATP-binding protein